MSGCPASGKTHKAKELLKSWDDCKYISRDEIRFSLIGDEDTYFYKEKDVWRKYIAEIQEGISNHKNTIADATHLHWPSRSKLLRALGSSLKGVKVEAIVVKPSFDIIIKQNAQRTGREFVPLSVLRRMNGSFTMPTEEEGFDRIWHC